MSRFYAILIAIVVPFKAFTQSPMITIETELGNIDIELFDDVAPLTAGNFLKYVDENMWRGASFYRSVTLDNQPDNEIKIEVIQGGLGWSDSLPRLPEIRHEPTSETGILHKEGVVSMARSEPGSASSEFFICVSDQPSLDHGGQRNPDGLGFAAFGRVVEGMDVVRKIHASPVDEQMIDPVIFIKLISRKD